MPETPGSTQRARAFVIRLAASAEGEWRGQASEPGSADEWRVTASSLAELWDRLERRLAAQPNSILAPREDPA